MTLEQFKSYQKICGEFRTYVQELTDSMPWLAKAQERLRIVQNYQDYRIETPIVYNEALDEIGPDDSIQFIFIADNPGKKEQMKTNQRYLVGQSGKLAQGWFAKELGMDFRKAGIILNKTPIHTPKTAELSLLQTQTGSHVAEFKSSLQESQIRMANFAWRLHSELGCIIWISGYGELRQGKIFAPWAREFTRLYAESSREMRDHVWVFRHFSMNQFAIEYSRQPLVGEPMARLRKLGIENRTRILGW
ncbi:MAG: hypothetical protein LLF89_09020 [Spirochaetaceae bacterium]|nr:hypothetical protein [Spirochaetaceae bacterium]